ncbi:MAG TPA: ribonucleoside triphosphate reductase [bacterium]|nr:ribonucleoside triphosphate reductase [bacterium]HOM26640.1 ribonucleoside triphosphate reductase [bacterium]
MFKKIVKRDGRIVDFDSTKITNAILKAGQATGEFGIDVAKKLTVKVLDLALEIIKDKIPTVEEIQDIVEEVLLLSPYKKTAKAYIIYREQHARIREITTKASLDLVDQYLNQIDWRVKENSNMSFSLQGLNNYVSSEVTKTYWLNNIYPPEIRKAYIDGDFHIHDLGSLSVYCVGWDLQDLLLTGFKGAEGKVESSPAKHFGSILGQIVNFFYTLQGESAGAQAFSNLDTLLAPFVRYDGLSYKEVKQAVQEFLFNLNVPTRTGFQCLSEDTEILTPDGWKKYDQVKKGDTIYTFNIKNGIIEKKEVKHVFVREYEGVMYNLKNRNQDQLISPGHRVVRRIFNTDRFALEPIEKVIELMSPVVIPVKGENINEEYDIEDSKIKLLAWILSEGSIEKQGSHRVSIYQSEEKHPENYNEIIDLLKINELEYSIRPQSSLGICTHIRLKSKPSKVIHNLLGSEKKQFPSFLLKLSKKQAKLFIDTYIKGNGWEEKFRKRITVTDKEAMDIITGVAVLAGYNFNVKEREVGGISKKTQYIITLTETQYDYIQEIKPVEYKGIIWSVNTENETVIARRNGQIFITGNTPFTNLTFDLKVSEVYKDQPVIIGGKIQDKTYGEFQKEMDMINKAFFEVMLEGDAKGRVFTFPIPTYNITKDFDWKNETLDLLWEMTGKYGIPYFSNFINSDMKPDDVRSMCCRLRLQTDELKKRGGGLFGANPLTGSIGVVTINLPRIGYLSKTKEEFKSRLNDLMEVAKESLEIKRKVLERFTDSGLYPYSRFYLRNVKERFGKYWVNHFSTIGIIGMNEACLNLFGKDIGTEEGINFAIEIMEFMREKLIKFQESTGNFYNLEATPAEGTSYRLARIDKNKYPDIIVANEKECRNGAEPFYTNSTHLPVNYTDDIFEVLEKQDKLQSLYTGGTVIHIFVGEKINSKEGIKKLVKTICENFTLPYFTITPTFSVCPEDGYLNGEVYNCPKCGKTTEIYSRIVGYLRPVSQWNKGKYEEFKIRKTFVLK